MTHSLHRLGSVESLTDDFCFMCIPERGVNSNTAPAMARKFLSIVKKYNPANLGVITCGNMYSETEENIINGLNTSPAIFCVLTAQESMEACLSDLKEADLGLSVVVTAVYDMVANACEKAGLKPHTVNHSLGIWGNREKLPPKELLEVTTMCGHAQVSANLAKHLIEEIAQGRTTVREAAITLAKPCVCGYFNPHRAEHLLARLTSNGHDSLG